MPRGKFPDSPKGAIDAANADYGLDWKPADVEAMIDPQVRGVWLIVNKKKQEALIVNAVTGEVVDEPFYPDVMKKYGHGLRPIPKTREEAVRRPMVGGLSERRRARMHQLLREDTAPEDEDSMRQSVQEQPNEATGDGRMEPVHSKNWEHLEAGNEYRWKAGRDGGKAVFVGWVDKNGKPAHPDEGDPNKVDLQFKDPDGFTWEAYFHGGKYTVGSSADALHVQEL